MNCAAFGCRKPEVCDDVSNAKFDFIWVSRRGVTIRKSHDSVRTSVFKSRFGMFFGTEGFKETILHLGHLADAFIQSDLQ